MSTSEMAAIANEIINLDKDSPSGLSRAREIVTELLLRVPQIKLSDEDRIAFNLVPTDVELLDYIQCVYYTGWLSGLIKKLEEQA